MGVRGCVLRILGWGCVALAGWRRCRGVEGTAGLRGDCHRVVGAQTSRPSPLQCGARSGNRSSGLGGADRDPPSAVHRCLSDAARGQHRNAQAGAGSRLDCALSRTVAMEIKKLSSDMTVLAVGAAGNLASLVVPELVARGAKVRGLVRKP